MSIWPCRWFRRRRKPAPLPTEYMISGTEIVADQMRPPPLAHDAHLKIVGELHPVEDLWLDIRWYLVRDEFLEGPDGRMRVPFEGKTYAVHGYAIGRRIILTPHGATSLDTIEHELRHIYGEHHDERGHWREDA